MTGPVTKAQAALRHAMVGSLNWQERECVPMPVEKLPAMWRRAAAWVARVLGAGGRA